MPINEGKRMQAYVSKNLLVNEKKEDSGLMASRLGPLPRELQRTKSCAHLPDRGAGRPTLRAAVLHSRSSRLGVRACPSPADIRVHRLTACSVCVCLPLRACMPDSRVCGARACCCR